ncbi:MAG: hypothetical protein RLP09_43200 [Sandaracinaceae bacterium]
MRVSTDGTPTMLVDGRHSVALRRPEGVSVGALLLQLFDEETGEVDEIELALDPSEPDACELFEWPEERLIVLGGADRILGLDTSTLRIEFSFGLMLKEGTTYGGLRWTVRDDAGCAALATEQRVWVLVPGPRIRVSWTTLAFELWTQTVGAPRFVGAGLEIDVRHHRGDSTVTLDLATGAWGIRESG